MKHIIFLLLLVNQNSVNTKKNNLAVKGISEIVKSHYLKNSVHFDIIIYGRLSKESSELKDLVKKIFKANKESICGKLIHLDANSNNEIKLTQSAIIFFESTTFFYKFNEEIELINQHANSMTFLVYFAKLEKTPKQVDPYSFLKLSQFQFDLIFDVDGSLRLSKYFRFQPDFCKNVSSKIINRFSPKTLKWENPISLDHETKDFYGCEFTVGVPGLCKPSSDYKIYENGSFGYFGYTVSFMDALGQHFNFKLAYNPLDIMTGKYLNKSFIPEIIAALRPAVLNILSRDNQAVTQTFTEFSYGIVIPHGELYTSLEKLFLPFDLETWILIIIFIVAGILVIEVIRKTSRTIQNFVFGRNNYTPKMNLIRVFYGMSLITSPSRNFARYMLMMFILFCLIMRTAYQGKMFQFLQKDMRKPEVKSIEEMIENNFTFFVLQDSPPFEIMELFQRFVYKKLTFFLSYVIFITFLIIWFRARFAKISIENFLTTDIFFNISKPGSKKATIMEGQQVPYMVDHLKIKTQPILLDQAFFTIQAGFAIHREFYFNQQLNRKIVQALESGLMNHWKSEINIKPVILDSSEPKVLTMDHLMIGFQVYVLCILICVIAFIWEIIALKLIKFLLM